MTNCGVCGAELAEGSSICQKCGKEAGVVPKKSEGRAKRVAKPIPPLLMRSAPIVIYMSGILALLGVITLSVPLTTPMNAEWTTIYYVMGLGMIAVGVGIFVADKIRKHRHRAA